MYKDAYVISYQIVLDTFYYYCRKEPLKDIPMLLVQGVDVYDIYKQEKCWRNYDGKMHCEVAIAFSPGTNRSNKDPLPLMPPELKQVSLYTFQTKLYHLKILKYKILSINSYFYILFPLIVYLYWQ